MTDIFAGASETDLRDDKAKRAIQRFRALQPGLTGYARALTKRKGVSVELATGVPRTDGKKIYYRPPISLGDPQPHNRLLCEKRDRRTLQQRCPACRIREEVLITIYHEIAHIAYGTFQEPSDQDVKDAIDRAIDEAGSQYSDFIQRKVKNAPYYSKKSYLSLSNLISPFLPILVNSLEDARVDSEMFKARKGTKVMFDAFCQKIFTDGVEQPDGTIKYWKDYPLNSQALIAVFVLACEYSYDGWFAPEIEDMMADKELRTLVRRIDTVRSAVGTYRLAFPILERLRELGFCRRPDEPEEEEQQDDQDSGDDGDSGESSDQESEESNQEQDSGDAGESGEDADSDADAESSGESGSGASDEADEAPEGDAEESGNSEGESDESGSGDSDDSESELESGEAGSSGAGESQEDEADEEPLTDDEEESGEGEADQAGGSSDRENHGDGDGGDRGASPEGQSDSDSGDDEISSEDRLGPGSESGGCGSGDPSEEPREVEPGDLSGEVDEDSSEPIDTGADEGKGGLATDTPVYGEPDSVFEDVKVFSGHDFTVGVHDEESAEDDAALDKAIIQGLYFEKPSQNIRGVRIHTYGNPIMEEGRSVSLAWRYNNEDWFGRQLQALGIDCDTDVPESILGPALLETRKVFTDNARAKFERHIKSGKINAKVLGKRAWAGDPRLFQKKRLPGKKSYAVLIGIDISGSTVGVNIALAKRAAMAQAELCSRAGIEFAVYAHTANGSWSSLESGLNLDIYEIKSFDDAWNGRAKEALAKIGSDSENLDGHSIEFYRKLIEKRQATDKIILYYSDGKMPAANHDEELEILRREIRYCKAHAITLMGVGIRTDSPRRHGLDTVQVNSDEDMVKVIRHLEKMLVKHQ